VSNEKQRILNETEGNESNEASNDVVNQIKLHRYMTVNTTRIKLKMPAATVSMRSDVSFISVSSSSSHNELIIKRILKVSSAYQQR